MHHVREKKLTEEGVAKKKRFDEAMARYEALPQTIADRAACRRAHDPGPNVKCTV